MDFNVIPSDVALLMGLGSQAQYPLHHFKLDLQASSASFSLNRPRGEVPPD
jgi:hypothetical protein